MEDTIRIDKENSKVYVIDSKYYRYGYLSTLGNLKDDELDKLLPNTSNISKQIIYGNYVKGKVLEEEKIDCDIRNIFIIPANCKNFIEYKGKAVMEWLNNNEVHLCFINMNYLIEKYCNREYDSANLLINIIESNIKKNTIIT